MQILKKYANRVAFPGKRWKDILNYELIEFLIKEIIFNDPTLDCEIKGQRSDWKGLPKSKSMFYSKEGCGLPIGNLTSQLFSNIYLSKLDNYVKRTLNEKYYGRYVDDFYIVHANKQHLVDMIPLIRNYLKDELGLTLHPNKIHLQSIGKGVHFLGAVLKPYRRYLLNKTRKRMRQSLKEMMNNKILFHSMKYRYKLNSYIGYLGHFKCFRLREHVLKVKAETTDVNQRSCDF